MPLDNEYPKFDETKMYLLSGKTLNRIINLIKRGRPQVTAGGGLQIDQETQDGIYLSAS